MSVIMKFFKASPILFSPRRVLTTRFKVMQNQPIRMMSKVNTGEDGAEPMKEEDYKAFFRILHSSSLRRETSSEQMRFVMRAIARDRDLLVDDWISRILHHIVIPTIRIGNEDMALFQRDYKRYIVEDIALESNRRGMASLLFVLLVSLSETAREMSLREIGMLVRVSSARTWKDRECGMRLAALMVGSNTHSFVKAFAKDHILTPHLLLNAGLNNLPMVKAMALRFLTLAVSGSQVSIYWRVDVLRVSALILEAEHNVVHSYAADCIREIFLNGLDDCDWIQYMPTIMINLFAALKFPGSEDNPYIMRCIYEVLLTAAHVDLEVDNFCLAKLTFLASQNCQNAELRGPERSSQLNSFQKNLLLALAILIRRASPEQLTQERLIQLLWIFHEMVNEHGGDLED